MNVDVYMRHEDKTLGVALTKWPINDLDGLIAWVKRWGVGYDDEVYTDACGQFVLTESSAGFEVIIS